EGLVDVIFPMNYDREARSDQKKFFEHWVKFETQYKYKAKTVVGIGAYMNSIEDGVAQTRFALANNADGVCYFSYNHIKKNLDDYRKALVEKPGPKGEPPPFATTAELPKVSHVEKPVQGACQGVSEASDAPAPANHDHKRLITAEDLWKVKRLGPPSLSPDGKWCVSEITTWDIKKDESTSELWLFATD